MEAVLLPENDLQFPCSAAIPYFIDAVFNGEVAMLFIGVCRLFSLSLCLIVSGIEKEDFFAWFCHLCIKNA